MAKAVRLLLLMAVAVVAFLATATPASAAPREDREDRGAGSEHRPVHAGIGVRAQGEPARKGSVEPQPSAPAVEPAPSPVTAVEAPVMTTPEPAVPASGPSVQAASERDRREEAAGTTGTTVVVPGPRRGETIVRGENAEALGPAQHIEADPATVAAASGANVLGTQHVRPAEPASVTGGATAPLATTGAPVFEPVGLAGGLLAIGTALTRGARGTRSRKPRATGRRPSRRPVRTLDEVVEATRSRCSRKITKTV